MQIHLTTGDGIPIYRQIVRQVKYLLAMNRLQPGDEMPPIRALAQQLLVNPNTVARAYRELESEGILTGKMGSGTFVSEAGSPLANREKERILTERTDALLAEAGQLGFNLDEVVEMVRKQHSQMQPGGESE